MEIQERFVVPAPVGLTYEVLNDVGGIGECIAGVQDVQVVSDDESRWSLEVQAGFMALQIALDARIVERVEDQRIGFQAEGQDVSLVGKVELSEVPDGTECSIRIDATIGGPLGPMADIMARGPQEQLVADTVRNIRARIETIAGPQAGAAASTNGGTSAPPLSPRTAAGRPTMTIQVPQPEPKMLGAAVLLFLLGYLIGRSRARTSG